MFRNVSKLNNLLNFYKKIPHNSISTFLSINFIYPTRIIKSKLSSFSPSSSLSSPLCTSSTEFFNNKLFNINLLILNSKNINNSKINNLQQIKYFSQTANRSRRHRNRKKRGRVRNNTNLKYDSRIPKLIYLHNPLKYLKTKFKFWKLKLKWDRKFNQKEFVRGTKQAAIVLTDIIRTQNFEGLSKFTTRVGFHQITRDMILSKGDPRLQMIQFRSSDLRRAIPVKVMLYEHKGLRHCLIDMFFVGMRNVNDFKTRDSHEKMSELIKKFDNLNKTTFDTTNPQLINQTEKLKKILFAEIFIRFYRDYTDKDFLDNWNVSFYKVLNFDILSIRDTHK